MNTAKLAGLLALALTGQAWAVGTVEVRASAPTRIYLDDEYVGETPIVLSNIQPGEYRIQAEDPSTGELRTYMFHSPSKADVSKVIDVDMGHRTVVAAPAPAPRTTQVAYIPRPAPAPRCKTVSYRYPRRSYERPRTWRRSSTRTVVYSPTVQTPTYAPTRTRSRRERAKVHTRNTLAGLILANQALNDNKRDRKRYRNVGLGAMVLNEIFR